MGKREIPGTARAGIGILIVGAILVGIGTYQEREPLSVYGAINGVFGFYFIYHNIDLCSKKN